MYAIDRCICCESCTKESIKYPALVADFIASYVAPTGGVDLHLIECHACGCRFFDQRFSDDECCRLYSQYRAKSYLDARHKAEFWYTKKLNDSIGNDPVEIAERKSHLKKIVNHFLPDEKVEAVLDIGGDRGQFIPDFASKTKKYLFEISDLPCEPDVRLYISKYPGSTGVSRALYLNAGTFKF